MKPAARNPETVPRKAHGTLRFLMRDDQDFERALVIACAGDSFHDGQGPPGLTREQRDRCDLVCESHRGGIRRAWAALDSPGSATLIFGPWNSTGCISGETTLNALRLLVERSARRGMKLFEILLDTGAAVPEAPTLLTRAGFRHLTQLVYLKGLVESQGGGGASELDWVPYSEKHRLSFLEALERSYVQSLDCPALTGVRSTAEVLDGHQATGPFDPRLWWVARREEAVVGILLAARVPPGTCLEIVYLGVAQPARGTGVANALMERAARLAREVSANMLTLAVDARNIPALRLYARWGLREFLRREAWIATPATI